MQNFDFLPTQISGLYLIKPFYIKDERGYFSKNFEKDIFHKMGINMDIQESIESKSHKGVLRGLHFQKKEPQAKLVRAVSGKIFDVAVDLRYGSETFGKWQGFVLDDENKYELYIPCGFAHGFLVLSDIAIVNYHCAGKYIQSEDHGIVWNDPDINIKWPNCKNIKLSPRDSSLPTLKEFVKGGTKL